MARLASLGPALAHNWTLKLMALALAGLSFYAIRGTTGFEVRVDLPLLVEVPDGIAVLEQDPRSVRVTFRGSQEDLRRLNPGEMKAAARPPATDPAGTESLEITWRQIHGVPGGVSVVRVEPASVRLSYDHEVVKKFPVARPQISGKPLVGRAEVDASPRFVMVRGPQRRLQPRELMTEPIDVEGRTESFSKPVRVIAGDAWISRIEPAEVTATVSIVTESVSREIKAVAVLAVLHAGVETDVTFEPPTVKVLLHGRGQAVEEIADDAVKVLADCTRLAKAGTYELPAQVHLPPGKQVTATVEPERIRAVVSYHGPRKASAPPGKADADRPPGEKRDEATNGQ